MSNEGLRDRLGHWVLLSGNRLVVGALIVVAVVLVVGALIAADVLYVGADGQAATLFASGLTAGVATLMTIALSINQLIISRVFGSPNDLTSRLEGTRELRDTVETLAGEPSSPNDPAAFLSLIARTLRDRASTVEATFDGTAGNPPGEVTTTVRKLIEYGEAIDNYIEEETTILDALDIVLGTEYARHMTNVDHLRSAHAEAIPERARAEFDAIDELLESIAVSRQFFKTLALQQDFGRLSRLLAYVGLVALVTAIALTLVYRTTAVTVPPTLLPVVVSVGIGVVVAPFAAFVSYSLRAATIARRTVSVGPFIPPEER